MVRRARSRPDVRPHRRVDAPRGDLGVFEQTPFITGVADGKVQFDYRGRHRVLFENITPADVRWICTQLSRLTDAQWHDAFRAGGFASPIADRFIRADEAEDRRRPRAEGLMRYLHSRPASCSRRPASSWCCRRAALRPQPPKAVEREQTEAFKQSIEGGARQDQPDARDLRRDDPPSARGAARHGAGAAAAAPRNAAARRRP